MRRQNSFQLDAVGCFVAGFFSGLDFGCLGGGAHPFDVIGHGRSLGGRFNFALFGSRSGDKTGQGYSLLSFRCATARLLEIVVHFTSILLLRRGLGRRCRLGKLLHERNACSFDGRSASFFFSNRLIRNRIRLFLILVLFSLLGLGRVLPAVD